MTGANEIVSSSDNSQPSGALHQPGTFGIHCTGNFSGYRSRRRRWVVSLLLIAASVSSVGAASIAELENGIVQSASSCLEDTSEKYDSVHADIACEWFVYTNDGLEIGGFIARPGDLGDAALPVVIFNRGGTGTFGRVDISMLSSFAFPLVREGFVVIGSQYRGGLAELDPPETADEWGGSEVGDVAALFTIIDALPYADGNRVGALGGSRGGIMTFLLAREPSRLKAVAVSGAPTDLSLGLDLRPNFEKIYKKHIPDYASRKEKALAERSVIKWVPELDSSIPVLIQHGQYDRRVGVEHALKLASQLQAQGRGYKLVIYELDDHYFSKNFDTFLREVIRWFKKYL